MKTARFTPEDQQASFVEAARELGADEDEAAFKAKLAVIGKQKPRDVPRASKHRESGDDA